MVDRAARDQYAELLRHFASGRMTNREYEDRTEDLAWDSEDPGLFAVWACVWSVYDDFRTHRLTGMHRLAGEAREGVVRSILFLQTDQEYQWPQERSYCTVGLWLVAFCLLGLYLTADLRWYGPVVFLASVFGIWLNGKVMERARRASGDERAWPFLRQEDLDEARRQPRLLAGKPGE